MKIWIIFQEARLFNVILIGAERKWPLVPTASLFADSTLATTQKKPQLTVLEMGSEEADHLVLSSPLFSISPTSLGHYFNHFQTGFWQEEFEVEEGTMH